LKKRKSGKSTDSYSYVRITKRLEEGNRRVEQVSEGGADGAWVLTVSEGEGGGDGRQGISGLWTWICGHGEKVLRGKTKQKNRKLFQKNI